MSYQSHWKIFCRVGNLTKAQNVLTKISHAMGQEIIPDKIERYWKIKQHYEVNFTLSLDSQSIPDVITDTLTLAKALAFHWQIATPSFYADNKMDFSGLTNRRISAIPLCQIEQVFFETRNY